MLRRSFLKGLGASLAGGFVFAGKATEEALAAPLPEVELPCDYGTYSVVDVPPIHVACQVTNELVSSQRFNIADCVMPEARDCFMAADIDRFGPQVASMMANVQAHVYRDSISQFEKCRTVFIVRRPATRVPVRTNAEA